MSTVDWTIDSVRALGATTDLVTAGSIFGLGRTSTYQQAQRGQLPFPVFKVGHKYVVPVPSLLHVLGATPIVPAPRSVADDTAAGGGLAGLVDGRGKDQGACRP